jgi:hypothetical protein
VGLKKILLVGDGPTVYRLPETLSGNGIEITSITGPNSAFLHSRFVARSYPILGDPTQAFEAGEDQNQFLSHLENEIYDFYIYSNDRLVRQIRDSALSESVKLRVLPVRNPSAMRVIDSKVELARMLSEQGVPSLTFEVIEAHDGYGRALKFLSDGFVLKGDVGHGGSAVVLPRGRISMKTKRRVESLQFPILAQSFTPEPRLSVEVLFLDGKLKGWIFSKQILGIGKVGPSIRRRYSVPDNTEFLISLETIGRFANLNGFFNTSWFFEPKSNKYVLFELDCRPNIWHQFGRTFGVDWSAIIQEGASESQQGPNLHRAWVDLSVYPRSLAHALETVRIVEVIRWALRLPGTHEYRNRDDAAVNRQETLEVLSFMRSWITKLALAVWQIVPQALRARLTRNGVKDSIATILGL